MRAVMALTLAWALALPVCESSSVLTSGLKNVLCRTPVRPNGPVGDSACDFPTVEAANDEFFLPLFRNLTGQTFFKYFRVNLHKSCPFWEDDGLCMIRDCSVCTCPDVEVPQSWREQDREAFSYVQHSAKKGECVEQQRVEAWKERREGELEEALASDELGRIVPAATGDEEPAFRAPLLTSDWAADDALDLDAVYINLKENPERFTGYAGASAHRIWRSIYHENCFSDGDACLEKRVFYRLISGLQASISTHIAQEYYYKDRDAWGTNTALLVDRVLSHKERTENLYFLYLFLLRAITKAGDALKAFDFRTGSAAEERQTRLLVERLVAASGAQGDHAASFLSDPVPRCCHGFDESAMFAVLADKEAAGGSEARWDRSAAAGAAELKEQFVHKFQNISRIMDCVGCEKCRLWGKLQMTGIGTALEVLFAEGADARLSRNEVIALINTAFQVSRSVAFVSAARDVEVEEKLAWAATNGGQSLAVLAIMVASWDAAARLRRWRRRRRRRKAAAAAAGAPVPAGE